jgi:gas vesicle protein
MKTSTRSNIMDKRMYDLLKRAEMMKTAGAISTAKNKAEQWGTDMKNKGSKVGGGVKTLATECAEDCSEGISTAKNDCEQWGDQVKADGKAVLKKISSKTDTLSAIKAVLAKQAMDKSAEGILDTLTGYATKAKGAAGKAAGKVAGKAHEYADKSLNAISDNPMTSSIVGGGAVGAGVGAAVAGKGKRLMGAGIGAATGMASGAALKYLVSKLKEHQEGKLF